MAVVQTESAVVFLIQENREQIRTFGVKRLGLFGAFVHDKQHETSDVDLLVEFETGRKTFDAFIQLAFFLEGLLGRRVELVTPESLSPYIGPRIMKDVKYVHLGP